VVVAGAGFYYYRQSHLQPMAILVNGSPVTTVSDSGAANALISGLAAAEIGPAYSTGSRPRVNETVMMRRVPMDSPIDSRATALRNLMAVTHLTVLADVISINGKPIVALPDKQAAQAAVDSVRHIYADMPTDEPPIDTPKFREKVTIDRTRTPAQLCKSSPEEAAQLLMTAPPPKLYVVKQGETGWAIAHKLHIPFTDFILANAGSDINHLKPGDTVNISATDAPLTVIVHKQLTTVEPIMKGTPTASAGSRRVTSIVTYINGIKSGESSPVSVFTIQRATPRRQVN
jgi:LysM repeat protein